jgi:glyoxylase-like metal-dependent hydrolase (beta-lactamase superfamily II)
MTAVEVDVIVTAQLPIPEGYAFRPPGNRVRATLAALAPGGGKLKSQCLAFLVRHPDHGPLLVDTGMHPDARVSLRKDFGTAMSVVFRGLRPAGEPFDAQLRARGVEPDDVSRVVMTHLHADHTSGLRLLPTAEVVLGRREWQAARGRGAATKGFVAQHLPPEERVRLLDLGDEPFDLLADGSVRLISTPGHTPGHLSVLLRTGQGDVLLAGDAAYTLRNIDEQILPLMTSDDDAARRSLAKLKTFTDEHPDAIVVPTHDPDAWRRLSS